MRHYDFQDVFGMDHALYQLALYEVSRGMILMPSSAEEVVDLNKKVASKFNYFKSQIQKGECSFDFIRDNVLAKNGPIPQEESDLSIENLMSRDLSDKPQPIHLGGGLFGISLIDREKMFDDDSRPAEKGGFIATETEKPPDINKSFTPPNIMGNIDKHKTSRPDEEKKPTDDMDDEEQCLYHIRRLFDVLFKGYTQQERDFLMSQTGFNQIIAELKRRKRRRDNGEDVPPLLDM